MLFFWDGYYNFIFNKIMYDKHQRLCQYNLFWIVGLHVALHVAKDRNFNVKKSRNTNTKIIMSDKVSKPSEQFPPANISSIFKVTALNT